jgi:hypothetical protein
VKKINREQDREFQALARALESLPPRRKASRAVQDAFSEGYESLEMDPDLLRPYDEEDDVNIAYARDYSRGGASLPGPGVSQDYYLSFYAPLADLGDGQVDTYNKTKGESGTFTRATVATCRLKSGLLKKVASGVPRSHYLEDGTYGGYLAEGARTNLCLRSEEFDNASWTDPTADATVTANATAAPDGTTTADLIIDDNALAVERRSQAFTVLQDALDHTFSVFVKQSTAATCAMRLTYTGGTPVDSIVLFTFATEALSLLTGSATGLTVESWGNGWYRLVMTLPNNNTAGSTTLRATVFPVSTTDVASTGETYFWGAQLEKASFASSYIPTTTAAVTRNADVLTYAVNGNASQTEGTLYAEAYCNPESSNAGASQIFVSLNEGIGNEEIDLRRTTGGTGSLVVFDGGAQQTGESLGALADEAAVKIVGSYAVNSFKASINGGAVSSDTAGTLPSTTRVEIGARGGGLPLFGTIKNVRIWQRQMPDALLQSMTA